MLFKIRKFEKSTLLIVRYIIIITIMTGDFNIKRQ